MTWRERVIEDRKRGRITPEERQMAWCVSTCALGEAYKILADAGIDRPWKALMDLDRHRVLLGFPLALINGDFDKADAYLDTVEDYMLVIKREAQP